ncbi:hypothetical protein O181_094265 [Austropuccinia psidii MF-1]|uniref:Peptidase A2 domain-containing protein n=1 Tax=Austropuccinia psidii MF-1 TaxID=1389203 RepID=A0A9Q3J1R9_9BASI|nr:hypothetical protein [Austropuccinia psidii MF-1]
MELVDAGSELKIITEDAAIKASLPNRKLNMNLRGIGGHTTSLIGLSELTQVLLPSGQEKEIHLFISKGAAHTVLGRPFLEDNNIRLDFSHKQGEIFSIKKQMVEDYVCQYANPIYGDGKQDHQEEWSFVQWEK